MHLPLDVTAVAAASTLAAVPVAALLAATARHHTGAARSAYRLLAAGVSVAALHPVAGLVALRILGFDRPPSTGPLRVDTLVLETVLVGGGAASTVLLLAGLLTLPGVVSSGGELVRHLLDAVLLAGAISFAAWVLITEPTRILGPATPPHCPVVAAGSAFTAMAIGIAVVVTLRAPGRRPAVLGGAIAWISMTGLGLAAGVRSGWEPVVLAAAGCLPAGLLVLGRAGYTADRRHRAAPADQPGAGPVPWAGQAASDLDAEGESSPYNRESLFGMTVIAFLPVGVISVMVAYQLSRGGQIEAFGLATGVVVGFALVARQYLALLDARRAKARLAERKAHFRQLAHTDPLTGLPNRRGLLKTLYDQVLGGPACVLLLLDLDGFKNINDMRGHDVGDAVLAEVGRRLRTNLRPGDVAARLGGDEFAVLMWARPPEAKPIAQRLLRVLSRPYEQPSGVLFLSASIGLASCATAADVPALLRNADLALRYAKQRGKSRVEQYDAGYEQRLMRRTTLEHELRGAIGRDELRLVFQPVVVLPSMRTVGAEALLRWHHPRLGAVAPDEFIGVAEECGMIAEVGQFVLHEACRQLSGWLKSGHDAWVSVNASPYELHSPEYVGLVAEVLRIHRVPPQRLVLEITEQVASPDRDELIRRLTALRATGVRIAVDDFGAGYNSLTVLRDLPVDILKIDKALVAELDPARGPSAKPLVDVVAALGHRLGLQVLAEGVTAPAQSELVAKAGCRFAQGELFGRAVTAEHLEALLAAAEPAAQAPAWVQVIAPPVAHYVRQVDSGRERRQA